MNDEKYKEFEECLKNNRPYFGSVMGASQGNPVRHYHMNQLVAREVERIGSGRPIRILEVGSWAGGSALTWASAIKKYNRGLGQVICVDPWRPYFDAQQYSELPDLSMYQEMQAALRDDQIFSLFLHNIKASRNCDIIVPFRGYSDQVLPLLMDAVFDLVFVDGAHDYASVIKDLTNCKRLVALDGIICGDDLELQLTQADRAYVEKSLGMDYVCDPLLNRWYHPGVTWGVAEQFGKVSERDGFWCMRRTGTGWQHVDIPSAENIHLNIPDHLTTRPIPVEEGYKHFNILFFKNRYHALSRSLGNVDLSTLDDVILAEYRKWNKYLVADTLADVKTQIIETGFSVSPELIEENVGGFNIVKYENSFYALSLSLGPFDLTSASREQFAAMQREGTCYVAGSLSLLKEMLKRKDSPASEMAPPGVKEEHGTGAIDLRKYTFSRELCLNYDGGEQDARFISALFKMIPSSQALALFGIGKLGTYILSLVQTIPDISIGCLLDEAQAGNVLGGTLIVRPADLPASVTTVFVAETCWQDIVKKVDLLPRQVRIVTLDSLAQLEPSLVPRHAWVPRIESIYPITIPDIAFEAGMDLILMDLPARSLAQMPAGFAYVHNALRRTSLRCQTVDLDIIIYHRYHSHRILDGLPKVLTPGGHELPEDPWQPVHYLEWENPDVIEVFRKEINEIVNGLILAQPKIIAFSLQQANLHITREVVKGIRSGLPEVQIVVGGMSCLQPTAAKIVFPEADYTVVGEADLIIGPLAEALAKGERPGNIPGVWSRYDSPKREFVPGPLPMQLDELEYPHYEWTDIQLYRNWNGYQLTPVIGSRGCSWSRCTFCGERFKWRTKSPELVVDEIEWLNHQGFADFVFNESNLHGDPLLTERLCDEIIRRGLKITMTAQLRCHDKVDERYYRKLRQAGFRTLRFGVDGTSTNTLKLQKKGYTKDMIRRNIADAARAGIYVQINLVIGVPGETDEDIRESIEFIGSLKESLGVVEFINPLMLFRGSDYWEDPEKFGIEFHSDRDKLYNRYLVAIPDSEWHSTSPYIDKDVRYERFVRVVEALRAMGVPMGDFANYTSEAVKSKQDLATTHNRAESVREGNQSEPERPENLAVIIPEDLPEQELSQLLADQRLKDAVLISGVGVPTPLAGGRRIIRIDSASCALETLREERFDLVAIPYGTKLGPTAMEAFVAGFCRRAIGFFPRGKRRLYQDDDFNRLLYNAAYLRSLFSHVPDLLNKRILEVGCSDRLAADLVANEQPGSIVAIDTMPCQPSQFDDARVTYVQMDAHRLEFPAGTFDVAYSIATLEHCSDPLVVLQEMKRVLRPGGYAYIQTAPLYHSPFGHHMFGYFDDYPWIHLRKSKEDIISYCRANSIDKAIEANTGQTVENYIYGMINPQHINGKTLQEYRLEEFMSSNDLEVTYFNRSFEGKNLLTPQIQAELPGFSAEDLVSHGFELVFRKKATS